MSRFNFTKFCVVVMAAYLIFGPQPDKSVFTADFMKNQGFGFKQVELRQRVLANADEDQSIPLFREAVKVEEKIVDQVHAQSLASAAPAASPQADEQEFTPSFSGQTYRLYKVVYTDKSNKKRVLQEGEDVYLTGEINLTQPAADEASLNFSTISATILTEEGDISLFQIDAGYADLNKLVFLNIPNQAISVSYEERTVSSDESDESIANLRVKNDKKDLIIRFFHGPLKEIDLMFSIESKEQEPNQRYIANQNVIKQQNTQFSSAPENFSANDQEVSEQSVAF